MSEPLLAVRGLVKHYPARRRRGPLVHAVCGVDLDLAAHETLALVGESGSGKSTVARTLLHLEQPTAGSVTLRGQELVGLRPAEIRPLRRDMQIVFQDPYASLDPRMTAEQIVAEPLHIHGLAAGAAERQAAVSSLLRLVGLDPATRDRHPASFSGGQRQRIAIARALALEPALLVLDEPLSALDVSIQAGVVTLLQDLQQRLGTAYLFIAHDLAVVRHLAHRVAVAYLGRIVETGPVDVLFGRPSHPYTQALLSATPVPDPAVERRRQRIRLVGEPPDPTDPPSGCRFRTRCPRYAAELDDAGRERCRDQTPALLDSGQGHAVACHFAGPVGFVAGRGATSARGRGQ
ncbi:MAG: peptide/nickel transport system ATP-binding protein [Frankiaceae bacterium]|nr:peptide/nickel transport system ATP-binding protein [Frankiaceae bacterium]MDQ1635215.1 peptide/nickel transport system ATP-binding protein [Frankiaceae bacterium]